MFGRLLTQFVSTVPDDFVARLPRHLREKCHVNSRVVGKPTRASAQFFVFELHEMTLARALTMFPVGGPACRAVSSICLD